MSSNITEDIQTYTSNDIEDNFNEMKTSYDQLNKLASLNEIDFKNLFLQTLRQLIKEHENNECKLYYLKYHRKKQEVNGIQIWRLKGCYSSVYKFWYRCYNYTDFFSKTKLPIYDYNTIQTIMDEKIEDGDMNDETDMTTVINWTIELFKENDTFWYECEEQPLEHKESDDDSIY